jgi:hypothetical protein
MTDLIIQIKIDTAYTFNLAFEMIGEAYFKSFNKKKIGTLKKSLKNFKNFLVT